MHRATFWYRNQPPRNFKFKTPEQLASDGRIEDVLEYVESAGHCDAHIFSMHTPRWGRTCPASGEGASSAGGTRFNRNGVPACIWQR